MDVKVDADRSFLLLVFPFTFDPAAFAAISNYIQQETWIGKGTPQGLWIEPTRDYLLQLVPEVATQFNLVSNNAQGIGVIRTLADGFLTSPQGLCCDYRNDRWSLELKKNQLQFSIEQVRIIVSRFGSGLLSLQLKSRSQSTEHWLQLIHFARFSGSRAPKIGVTHQLPDQSTVEFVPGLMAKGCVDGKLDFDNVFERLLATIIPKGVPWLRSGVPTQLLSFAGTFIHGSESEFPESIAFRLRNHFRIDQLIHPTASQLELPQSCDVTVSVQQHHRE